MPKVVNHDERRDLIIQTAIEMFVARGYAKVGMRDLASELGMTKSALYHYFTSKRELFAGVVASVETRDLEEAQTALSQLGNLPLPERIAAFLQYLEQRETWFVHELAILLEAHRLGEAPSRGGRFYEESVADLLGISLGAARTIYFAATGLLLDRALGREREPLSEVLSWLVGVAGPLSRNPATPEKENHHA